MSDEDDILAGEIALGLLDGGEYEAAQVRLRNDAAFGARIEWWRDRLSPLISESEAKPGDVWPRIAARLGANDNNKTLMQRWRTAAVGAMSVAAALLAFIALRPDAPIPVAPPVPTPMVAMLAGDKGAVATIGYDASSGRMTITPSALEAKGGDAELWIIPEGGKPRSMGVLDATAQDVHMVSPEARSFVRPGATFAVSLEPKGGSVTGAPTGPVIATGKIIRV